MKRGKFPIVDLEFHKKALESLSPAQATSRAYIVEITYHTTAAAYLEYGAFHGMGAAVEIDGNPTEIHPEFQLGIDEYGNPFMRHFTKEQWEGEQSK